MDMKQSSIVSRILLLTTCRHQMFTEVENFIKLPTFGESNVPDDNDDDDDDDDDDDEDDKDGCNSPKCQCALLGDQLGGGEILLNCFRCYMHARYNPLIPTEM